MNYLNKYITMRRFLLLAPLFFLFACSDTSDSNDKSNLPVNFTIDGEVLGAANQTVFVEAHLFISKEISKVLDCIKFVLEKIS